MVVELIDLEDDGYVDVRDWVEEMEVGREMEGKGDQQCVLTC